MNRKQRRQLKKKKKKSKVVSNDVETKLGLFELIPDSCMICKKQFDKKDREMVTTWNVVVREKQKKVSIYCPSCWKKAQDLLSDLGISDK